MFFTLPNAIFFYFLFNDFYQKSYKSSAGKVKAEIVDDAAKCNGQITYSLKTDGANNNSNINNNNNNLISKSNNEMLKTVGKKFN